MNSPDSHFDYVITVCDNAHETCPAFPASTVTIHQSFRDPGAFHGSEEDCVALFRKVRDEIRAYLRSFPAPRL